VVRSKTANLIRRNARRTFHDLAPFIEQIADPSSHGSNPAVEVERQWEAAMVMIAMEELRRQVTEINYRVLEMRLVQGRTEAETAAVLNLTPEQVRYRKHRTQRKLQLLLAAYTGKRFE